MKLWKNIFLKKEDAFSSNWKELRELLPRYAHDNLFMSARFKNRFPEFPITTYEEGIKTILEQMK